MPVLLGFVTIAVDLLFIIHAVRTGRDRFWIWIILGFPIFGAVAYVLAEVLPEAVRGPRGAQARARAADLLDPERAYREAQRQLEISDTIETRRALAREALRLDRAHEALSLLQPLRQGLYAEDPTLLTDLAEAQFAAGDAHQTLAVLDDLKRAHPNFQSAEMHLLYARALEASGRIAEALQEYAGVAAYYPGEEARCRRAQALEAARQDALAQTVWVEVVRSVERSPAYYRRAQRQWYDLARSHLRQG